MDRLRILSVYAGPFPAPFGTQGLVSGALEQLAGRGHEVHLAVYEDRLQGKEPSGVVVHRGGASRLGLAQPTGPAWQRPIHDMALLRTIARLLDDLRPDLLYAHHYEALVAAAAARRFRPLPLVFHSHALWRRELAAYGSIPSGLGALLGLTADRTLPKFADRVVALSDAMTREIEKSGVSRHCIDVVRPGVDLDEARPDREESRKRLGLDGMRVVSYLGNLEKYQGVGILVDAVRRLKDLIADLVLVIASHEKQGNRIDALMQRSGIRTLTVPGERWSEVLAASDVVAVPRTVSGGVPIKTLNALAAARPVVTTMEGAFDLGHGTACWIVPANDADSLAHGIGTLLGSPDLAARIAGQGRLWVEKHCAWDDVTTALETSLEKALESRAR